MPQIFEGNWRSVLIGGNAPTPDPDQPFHLEVDSANHLKSTSTHLGQITGDVTDFTISITETFLGVTSTYVGNLCGEVMIGQQRHLLVCGVMTVPGVDLLDEKTINAVKKHPVLRSIFERDMFDGQIQEIWVATKP